jgi:hypothetical protein
MERSRHQQTIAVNRGLFLVRYAAAEDTVRPPTVTIAPASAPNENFDFLLHPDHDQAVLWQPDSCLVMRTFEPGNLSVEVRASHDGGSAAATVRIEPLTQGRSTETAKTTNPGKAPLLDSFRVLGHVTGIGDQEVGVDQWLGGPSAPSRIEGISIRWPDKPHDLDIRYAAKTAKPQPTSGIAVGMGAFSGTRGKTMPIVALLLEMSGSGGENLQFIADALFLGATTKRVVGKRLVASGPTGREPLVGLRISVSNVSDEKALFKTSNQPSGEPADTIRVFHSRSKLDTQRPSNFTPSPEQGIRSNGKAKVGRKQVALGKQQKRADKIGAARKQVAASRPSNEMR